MISSAEAASLLSKWLEEDTPLRFDGQSTLYAFSVEGRLESTNAELVRFRVNNFGYIEINLPPDTGFGYFPPDSIRLEVAARFGEHRTNDVSLGSGLIAIKQTGENLLFIEIIQSRVWR